MSVVDELTLDIDAIIDKAKKSGKITKQQRADWIRKVLDWKEKKLSMKELAAILDVSYTKVQKDWACGRIPDAIKQGPGGTRCRVSISKKGAIDYILVFEGTDEYDDPRQRKLPFPGD